MPVTATVREASQADLAPAAPATPEAPAAPLFSVIVPLEYHRGQWERCWQAWRAQTLARSRYETILVLPPAFPERGRIEASLGPHDRLVDAAASHDIGLCALGAAQARGRYLFFTESHCWPEPDVLERCERALDSHPEWSAFSCQSVRAVHNRLSSAEADMYEADIEHGAVGHPWRKVLDQCFVTRREAYEQCGGLRPEFGHFAEWVLAANYFALGHAIGYFPDARLHHYNVGELPELESFTRDFITGEMRYFASGSDEPGRHLHEVPREWIGQGSRDRRLARSLLRLAARDLLLPSRARLRRPAALLGGPLRWLLPALGGDAAARAAAAARVGLTQTVARAACVASPRAQLSAAFRAHIAALIHQQRLSCLSAGGARVARGAPAAARDAADTSGPTGDAAGWDVFAPGAAGFHPVETWQRTRFRWSEPVAILPGWLPAGRHRLRIECLPVLPVHDTQPRVYLDGRRVPARDVELSAHGIELRLERAEPGPATLAWSCAAFAARCDRRRLGLPVERIGLTSGSRARSPSRSAPTRTGS